MENQKTPEASGDERWLDDILEPQTLTEEIGPDEDAVSFAGLGTSKDDEFDKFLEELKNEDWVNATLVQPVITEPAVSSTDSVPTDATMVHPLATAYLTVITLSVVLCLRHHVAKM